MERPIAIDLFAGAGGLSLGLEQAGFNVAAAIEIDPIHAAVHKFNFPQCAVIPQSVIGLSASEIRALSGIGNRKVNVIAGGAPCQGFSLIGQRALDDPRNSLIREFVRIVRDLDASYFVFENVKGLTVGKHRHFLEEVIASFNSEGYLLRAPWQVLNARNHGVPQDRERLFLLGAKKDLPLPLYPDKLPLNPTCGDALNDLPDLEDYTELNLREWIECNKFGEPSAYARELRCIANDAWHFGIPRIWNPGLLTSSRRTFHTEISRKRFAQTPGGENEPISRFYRLARDGVSNTLRAGTDAARGAFTSPRPIHYEKPRCVSVREMARLHGYPDWFRFHGTKWHGARQVGNSVPPPLARAVAAEVLKAIGYIPVRQTKAIELGDPALLTLDMNGASSYWGVEPPIGRRDRKSGAKKRKQEEIEFPAAEAA
ncbi:MAG: DNA cytosine methyltransferase [Aestuariivirga sp.]